jgi:hypothetical protein
MSRDLLYKPNVPVIGPEESDPKVKKADKTGTKGLRGRDLGGVTEPSATPEVQTPAETPAVKKTPAYRAAYFNRDSSSVKEINQRQSGLKALRGAEGASDLRKVVLPPAAYVDTPNPEVLRGASDLMGLDGSFELDLQSLLGRQSAWTRGQGVTAETIEQRKKQLERMVEARKAALARMKAKRAASVTVEQAVRAGGKALTQVQDVVSAGRELVGKTAAQAAGMHRRIAKTLGIKPPK